MYLFLWFLKSDANPRNVILMECVMMPLYSQVLSLESLVPSPDFRYHQVTKVAPLLAGQAEGPTVSLAHLRRA